MGRAEILDLHVSDHRPLLVELKWKGARRYEAPPEETYVLQATAALAAQPAVKTDVTKTPAAATGAPSPSG
jgi:hypothetical protein